MSIAIAVLLGETATASIRHNMRTSPTLVEPPGLGLDNERFQNAADVIVESAIRSVPVPTSGADYTFRWDPAKNEYVRTSGTFGPLTFMERAETIGRNMWNVGLTFQYLELDEFDGNTVGSDPVPIAVGGEPVAFSATPKIIYHATTLNVTYGITDDLDINVAVPIYAIDFDLNARRPFLPGCNPDIPDVCLNTAHGKVSVGLGDIHLRAKYHLLDWEGMQTALGVDVRLPTGQATDALGTGNGSIQPYVAWSQRYFTWIEPHLNAGFEFDLNEVHRSRAHYSLGTTLKACEWFDVAFQLLGQSEVDGVRAEASVSGPHILNGATVNLPYEGVSVDRKDFFDAVIGARFRVWETITLTGGVMKSINDDGVRASQWSPIFALEGTF
jgi:hypothetical protein